MEECEINFVDKFQEPKVYRSCSGLEDECKWLRMQLEHKQDVIHALTRFLYSKGLMHEFNAYTSKKYQQAYDRQDETAKRIFGETWDSEHFLFN